MGCGTGDLLSGDKFTIVLRFTPRIDRNDPVYTHFEDAVRAVLRERLRSFTPSGSSGEAETVEVVLGGPLAGDERRQLNRAMNRVLWGVRSKCPAGDGSGNPLPSGFEVKVDSTQKNEGNRMPRSWRDEGTCTTTPP